MSLLPDFTWEPKYDGDGRSLVHDFFVPALMSATRYDRTTGYFSAGILTLASRGVEGLVRNGGRMRLVVGCTLSEPEVQAVERGQQLRATVQDHLAALPLQPADDKERQALELLSWMVAHGHLEIRVAVPCTATRKPMVTTVIFHEKAGIMEDKAGNRLAFNGSVNETAQGWAANWESFHAFPDWQGGSDRRRVDIEEESFQKLWNDKAQRCLVIDVPTAVRDGLLQFLPSEGILPARLTELPPVSPDAVPPRPAAIEAPVVTEVSALRDEVWQTIAQAPRWPKGGEWIGEATSIVTPWPHQVRAFERLYRTWPPKLLVADEVGLGKTIEAGLLLRQAVLAGQAKRVLVLAPKAVLTQWQIELREKFNLNWPIYDGNALSWYECRALEGHTSRNVSRAEWHREPFVITSSQLMRRTDRVAELTDAAEPWDLVVLDEAHHARRKGAGLTKDRKPNQLLSLMQRVRTRTQGLVLLTATPMQVSPVEVWDLLDLLGLPPGWDEKSFISFFTTAAHPHPSHVEFEFLAEKFRAAERHFGLLADDDARRLVPGLGALAVRKVLQALRDVAQTGRKQLETSRRQAAVRVMQAATPVARLVSRHTRELLRRYYRAGKITSRIADRDVDDVLVPMTPAERAVYEGVEDYISRTYAAASQERRTAVGFVMTVYRKRVASSFAALRETLSSRLEGLEYPGRLGVADDDVPDDDEADESIDVDEAAELAMQAAEGEAKAGIHELLEMVRRLPVDTKASHLATVLQRLQADGYRQVLVFTQFTDTLDFLREHLAAASFRVMCFSGRGGERRERSGRWLTISRDEVKRVFRAGEADILLCTDAAAEGLNFQFCGALVNYDMPWNPMRVEQRIGRIDRLGQKFPRIRILNLQYEDTVETDVYRALRERIGLFTTFVGRLQPILAKLPKQLAETMLLAPREQRDRAREALLSNLSADVTQIDQGGFDLDAITEGELDEPQRPAAYYDLDALDRVLRRPDLLPPGVTAEPMGGPREYKYSAPGMRQPLRVTTDPDYYDQHASSVELWSPGSPLFPVPELPSVEGATPQRSLDSLLGEGEPGA
ncbi:MAG: helicase-related protein [Vicinamibacterales bacterium]